MRLTAATLADLALANPVNAEILQRLPALGAPQAHLVAGCLFQAVWNHRSGHEPGWGVKDYDVFYFDGADLSWEAEDRVIRRAEALFADLGVTVEVRNQARVHLWYPEHFGEPYPRLTSARDGIDRYLIACTCLGITPDGEVYAPDSLEDLWEGRLRMNPRHPQPRLFPAKAESYRARWPWLSILG
ncbi:nucleotidyltransferase family protein [Pseudoroseomonas wenyumeiae]|uniref:Nucleotidyltransferase family protein n=1 Tax=Teichococcus wenyumeiae TaxID=2478470 RepID=A0A3A9JEX4_9PROT|nr:nucleotidyltransferase family protein [Pseudoroseomonas wenyumeiae]RKK02064.1 nucleotidyltransferase family protein [Pseudoroseomonas wenyumeiae]RMI25855.1 nucleotidyltransferase family protein [Pseudoroseomonas wenyumeiae]